MTNRRDYLYRVVQVLRAPAVDGVMATMDVLEELLLLEHLSLEAGMPSFLNNRLLIASVNRGGTAGSAWELRDPPTGATAQTIAQYGLDAAKLLLRFDPEDVATLDTLQWVAQVVRDMNACSIPTFLEPLPATPAAEGLAVVRDPSAIATLVGIASALGDSSRYLWLKLPFCEDFAQVAKATTLPIVLLGGPASDRAEDFVTNVADAMHAGNNVRGVMLGRNVLYPASPPDAVLSPRTFASIIGSIVHDGWTATQALTELYQVGTRT